MITKKEKQDWVAALRSGNYEQARGTLRTSTGYCCLGVLCDILNQEGWNNISNGNVSLYVHEGSMTGSSKLLEDKLGQKIKGELIPMNDVGGYTFQQIADWIEENVNVDEG